MSQFDFANVVSLRTPSDARNFEARRQTVINIVKKQFEPAGAKDDPIPREIFPGAALVLTAYFSHVSDVVDLSFIKWLCEELWELYSGAQLAGGDIGHSQQLRALGIVNASDADALDAWFAEAMLSGSIHEVRIKRGICTIASAGLETRLRGRAIVSSDVRWEVAFEAFDLLFAARLGCGNAAKRNTNTNNQAQPMPRRCPEPGGSVLRLIRK